MFLGICGFALFFLSDYNDWKLSKPALKWCFPAGAALVAAATVWGAVRGTAPVRGVPRLFLLALGAVFFALLIHALFFALPAQASYARPGEDRPACTAGVYALCRHPGVLWFVGLYACLWCAAGLSLWEAAVYCGLNVGLIVFEDVCVFPAKLAGYEDYRRTTPFLIPTAKSIRACRKAG